jgi:hypothetical protein
MRFRLVLVVASATLSGLSLAACGVGTSPNPNPSTPPTSTGSTGTDVIGTPPPASYPDTANAYAQAAIEAWRGADATRLAQLDDPADTFFHTLGSGNLDKSFALYQCTGAAGSSICVFYNSSGDEADVRLRNDRLGQAHAVGDGQVHPITFPTDYQAYGQEALDAWRVHNSAAVALLTGKPGESAFNPVPAAVRDQPWTYDHAEGATGHQYFEWRDAAGDSIAIGFANPGFVTVPANRHGLIENVVFTPHP